MPQRDDTIEAIKRRAQPLRAARRSALDTPDGGWLPWWEYGTIYP